MGSFDMIGSLFSAMIAVLALVATAWAAGGWTSYLVTG